MKCCFFFKTENAVRIIHFTLTFGIFFLLLKSPSDLHEAWKSKSGYFFCLLGLTLLSLFVYLLVSLVDPGYLPRESLESMALQGNSNSSYNLDEIHLSTPNIATGTKASTTNYCRVCHNVKPMRAKHCYSCGRCVRKFDHHCPWIGNCVGERNHCYFWLFVALESALLVWGTMVAWSAVTFPDSLILWLWSYLLILLSLIVMFISAFIVSILFLYHSYLMLTGQTTWEQASRGNIHYLHVLEDVSNPFNEGSACNILRFICTLTFTRWEDIYSKRTETIVV